MTSTESNATNFVLEIGKRKHMHLKAMQQRKENKRKAHAPS